MRLETNRLVLREFAPEDWEAVHEYASDVRTTAYMLWGPHEPEQTRAFVDLANEWRQAQPRTHYELAITLKDSGKLIGGCGLTAPGMETGGQGGGFGSGELGYILHRDYWRQGYGSEAAEALMTYGFGVLNLHRIQAYCHPDNKASAGVMTKIGMQYEGHLRENLLFKGVWRDSLLHAMLQSDWRERQGGEQAAAGGDDVRDESVSGANANKRTGEV